MYVTVGLLSVERLVLLVLCEFLLIVKLYSRM